MKTKMKTRFSGSMSFKNKKRLKKKKKSEEMKKKRNVIKRTNSNFASFRQKKLLKEEEEEEEDELEQVLVDYASSRLSKNCFYFEYLTSKAEISKVA